MMLERTRSLILRVELSKSTGDPEKDSWIDEYKAAGVNWYVEVMMGDDFDKFLEKFAKGPP